MPLIFFLLTDNPRLKQIAWTEKAINSERYQTAVPQLTEPLLTAVNCSGIEYGG